MEISYSGLLTTPPRKDAPLVVVKDGALVFEFHPDPLVMRARITDFERRLKLLPDEDKIDLETENTFVDGMLVRKMFAAKGTVVVGKVHLKPCVNFVESGDMSVLTETGFARVKAGFNVVSPAGLQKVGIAHEDTVFVNVFRVTSTNIEDALKEVACDTHEDRLALEGEISCQ